MSKRLYCELFENKETDSVHFLYAVLSNLEHHFWGACRDVAREVLSCQNNYKWLSFRVDDFAMFVEGNICKKLPKWIFRANLGIGGLAKHINEVSATVSWLMDRYINEMKNLFDERYKNYIDVSTIKIVDYEVDKCSSTYLLD